LGIYLNQGQCCCAGSRLFVEEKVHDQLVSMLVNRAKARKVGDPFAPDTEQGPQIDQAQFDKIMEFISKGKQAGANCVVGGNRVGTKGYFVEPTIFTDVRDDMEIARHEIFGPVLAILKFKDIDEVIRRANSTYYGLAAAVWTRDITKAHRIADEVRAGTVWINCYDAFDAAAPFGGYKMSGQGRELGAEGLKAYTETKTVIVSLG
jgi:aldehyde dehydrogenase (NAD+)